MNQYQRLGAMLVSRGVLTENDLAVALSRREKSGMRLGEILVFSGMVSEVVLAECLAEQYDYPFLDPENVLPEPGALALIPFSFAMANLVLPYRLEYNSVCCLIADPLNVAVTDSLAQQLRMHVRLSVSPATKLYRAIEGAYGLKANDKEARVVSLDSPGGAKEKGKKKASTQDDRSTLLSALTQGAASAAWDAAFGNEGGKKLGR